MIKKVSVEKVFCIEVTEGDGTQEAPYRLYKYYYAMDGTFIIKLPC